MSATNVSPTSSGTVRPRRMLSVLDVMMLVGLFLIVVADGVAQILDGAIVPPVLIFEILYLLCGLVVATGFRWAMLLPLVICPLGIISGLASGFPEYTLIHPASNAIAFSLFVLEYPFLSLVICNSAVKLVQTVRREPFHMPRWLRPAPGFAVGLLLGSFLIGNFAQAPAAGSTTTSQAGSVTVHLLANRFSPDIIALHKGDRLLVVDDSPVPHTLANGVWGASNQAAPGVEPGAPVVNNVSLNNNSVTIGPFVTPGTYHLYCTVHPGMSLTILVGSTSA